MEFCHGSCEFYHGNLSGLRVLKNRICTYYLCYTTLVWRVHRVKKSSNNFAFEFQLSGINGTKNDKIKIFPMGILKWRVNTLSSFCSHLADFFACVLLALQNLLEIFWFIIFSAIFTTFLEFEGQIFWTFFTLCTLQTNSDWHKYWII